MRIDPTSSPEHILPHRLWVCVSLESELTPAERAHIRDCEICMGTMRVCLRSETFGAVLRELEKPAKE